METNPNIRWSTSQFEDAAVERSYGEESWASIRLITAFTLIGFSVAWAASVSLDHLYLKGTGFYVPVAGLRAMTGITGVAIGLWLLISRPAYGTRLSSALVYLWVVMSTMTAIAAAWSYPILETTADGRTDLLLSTCYWMSIQILGLGTALSAWRPGVVLMAVTYAASYIIQAFYWAPQLEHTLEGQIIVIVAASLFAVILAYLFARRARQRFYMTQLYEQAKVTAERAQEFTTFLLAATGHDIRQPIFALNLNASMLKDVIQDRDWEKAAALAERQSQALAGVAGLISSVLELSQLDTDRRHVMPETLTASRVMEAILAPIGPLAMQRGLEVRHVSSGLKAEADRGVVEHILANLLFNAISHSGADTILVGAKRSGDMVDLMVMDNGKGLSDRPRTLTAADIQPGQTRQARRGLGVEIMFRLAEQAGLDLVLGSEPGRGVAACLRCPRVS